MMRKFLVSALGLMLSFAPVYAQSTSSTTILQLPPAGPLTGTEIFPIDQLNGLVPTTMQTSLNAMSLFLYAHLPPASATVPGGVLTSSAPTHQYATGINSGGSLIYAQPQASDVAGLSPSAFSDTTNASNITSGTLSGARLPAPTSSILGGILAASAPAHQYQTGNAAGTPTFAQPSGGDLLAASVPGSALASGAAVANIGFTPISNTGGTASGNLGAATGGVCDTSQWNAFIGGTASPQPTCFASKIAPSIALPFPAVVGINGTAPNDQTHIQYAQGLTQCNTTLGNSKQESCIVGNMISGTGGGGAAITNWNEKVNLYLPTLVVPGAANTWAINDDLTVLAGVGNYSMYRHEGDMVNFNGDYVLGGCNPCASGQINGNAVGDFLTFLGSPITAGMMFTGTPNANSANMHDGIIFQSTSGMSSIGTGLIQNEAINDSSNSPISLRIYGNHTSVIDSTLANTLTNVIRANIGQKVCLNIDGTCFVAKTYSGATFMQSSSPLSIASADSSGSGIALDLAVSGSPSMVHYSDGATYNWGVGGNNSGGAFEWWNGRYPGVAGTKVASLSAGGALTVATTKVAPVATASLPACNSTTEGTFAAVTDANATTYNSVVAGGGTNHMPVYCNGTNWTLH